MSTSTKPSIEIVAYRAMDRDTLRGFATIRIPAMRLTLRDFAVHESGDRRWALLRAKPQLDRDQQVVREDGKLQYSTLFQFDSRDVGDAFSEAVLRAVDTHGHGPATS
jgi:hypothetical protein